MIRYLTEMSMSPVGKHALSVAGQLRALGKPLRCLSVGGIADLGSPWAAYIDCLSTPLSVPFVNVVCCHPKNWVWDVRVSSSHPYGGNKRTEGGGVAELHTAVGSGGCLRNVLVVPPGIHHQAVDERQMRSAAKYELVVVAPADMTWWDSKLMPLGHAGTLVRSDQQTWLDVTAAE